jgi:hypothetical protein
VAGLSKQSLYKYRQQESAIAGQESIVVDAMDKMRKCHKKMSSRKVYAFKKEILGLQIGRDKFEQIAFANGYRVKHKRQTHKTTYGQRVEVYPDLVSGRVFNNINQVYQSDIFYLKVADKDYYGITIIDAYSKRLVALHLSKKFTGYGECSCFKKGDKGKNQSGIERVYLSFRQGYTVYKQGTKRTIAKPGNENKYV